MEFRASEGRLTCRPTARAPNVGDTCVSRSAVEFRGSEGRPTMPLKSFSGPNCDPYNPNHDPCSSENRFPGPSYDPCNPIHIGYVVAATSCIRPSRIMRPSSILPSSTLPSRIASIEIDSLQPQNQFLQPQNQFCNPKINFCDPKITFCNPKTTFCNPKSISVTPTSISATPKSIL